MTPNEHFVRGFLAELEKSAAFPLKNYRGKLTKPKGAFGKVRDKDVHTGVDLYARAGTTVYAVEDGVVVSVEDFTGVEKSGPDAEYGYLPTQVAMVKGKSGVVAYGEIAPAVKKGTKVKEGDVIGHVKRVLPKSSDGPRSMLHFELYTPSSKATVWWKKGKKKPRKLIDPTSLLRRLKKTSSTSADGDEIAFGID